MRIQLKPVREQVIVITGATSGIGLTTAREAARRGASLVLVARNDDALRSLAAEINAGGGEAAHVAADVASFSDLLRAAEVARDRFGGFDTWINNAGVSIFGRLAEVSLDDMRRLFDTNLWGTVNGSIIAADAFRDRLRRGDGGGAIINIGSVVSDVALPMQGIYSASKHAVKGFTDALRMELEHDGLPIAVTLIKPTSIDTPYVEHAKNYMDRQPTLPPPVYAPEVVADAILYCARNPTRDLYVGGAAKAMASMRSWAPRLSERAMEQFAFKAQRTEHAAPDQPGNLYEPRDDLRERSRQKLGARGTSLYTEAVKHPIAAGAIAVGAGLAIAAVSKLSNARDGERLSPRRDPRLRPHASVYRRAPAPVSTAYPGPAFPPPAEPPI